MLVSIITILFGNQYLITGKYLGKNHLNILYECVVRKWNIEGISSHGGIEGLDIIVCLQADNFVIRGRARFSMISFKKDSFLIRVFFTPYRFLNFYV